MNKRNKCNICGYEFNANRIKTYTFTCNVKHFQKEQFAVWRCPICNTIHCLNIINLDRYYAHYFYENHKLKFPYTLFYNNLLKQLKSVGLTKESQFLDYGCANGQFVAYLKTRGYSNCYGYDPYSSEKKLKDEKVLEQAPFDFILLQDVIEHVEDPKEVLNKLKGFLKTGGILFIGTPNADMIDLENTINYINEVHVPYHLHIYGEGSLKQLCEEQGFQLVHFFDRSYLDIPVFGLNELAQKIYQELMGGTLDDVMGKVNYMKLATSPKFLFCAIFGYILSHKANMGLILKKVNIWSKD